MHPLTIIAVALTAIGIAARSVLITERDRMMKEREREEEAFRDYFILWGDVPFIPREFEQRAAKGSPGGGAGNAARALDGRTHRDASVTR